MQQMREASPWDQAPRYLLRDRDAIYGRDFSARTREMGMEEVFTAPRSPWQNPFVERLVGSIRRECLDQVIVWNERSLRRTLQSYFAYYRSRTHLALGKDSPEPRGSGTARTGARGSNSSGRGTSPPIPAPGSLVGPRRIYLPFRVS
jgi:putative transposase